MKAKALSPLTPAQIRAGRALVDISQQTLADDAGLSLSSVRDYENERRGGVMGGLKAIQRALEKRGVMFIPSSTDAGPGVRLGTKAPTVLRRPNRLAQDALLVPVEWQGREFAVLVSREVLEDLGRIPGDRELSDPDYVALFEQHRVAILTAAATAIEGGQVTPDRRVYVTTPEIFG
jgi:transcriptional regulator with XRE-family HTH domain